MFTLENVKPELGVTATEVWGELKDGFIAEQVMPLTEVGTMKGTFKYVPQQGLLKVPPTLERAAKGTVSEVEYSYLYQDFECKEKAVQTSVDDQEKLNAASDTMEAVGTSRTTYALRLDYERAVATKVGSNFGDAVTASVLWSSATAKAVKDVNEARRAMRALGLRPNALVMSTNIVDMLMEHDAIKTSVPVTQSTETMPRDVFLNHLKSLFRLDYIYEASTQIDTAPVGIDSALESIWPDDTVYLMRIARTPSLVDLAPLGFGRTFVYNGSLPSEMAEYADFPKLLGSAPGIVTEKMRNLNPPADVYRCTCWMDTPVFSNLCNVAIGVA